MRFFSEPKDSAALKAAIDFLNNYSVRNIVVDPVKISELFEAYQEAYRTGLSLDQKHDVEYVDPAPWYDDDSERFEQFFVVNSPVFDPNDATLMIQQFSVDSEGDWDLLYESHHVALDQPILEQVQSWHEHSQEEARNYIQLQAADYHIDWARYYLSCLCNQEILEITGNWQQEVFSAKSCEDSVIANLRNSGLFELQELTA